MAARLAILLLSASALLDGCAQGTDESDVTLRVYEGMAICDREGCWDERGNEVPGEPISTGAILSRSASRFEPGVYLYVGSYRSDQRYLELEVDIPTGRTGTTGVEALYREFRDGEPVYESAVGGGQVRLILEDRASNPPAGRFDLTFEDGRGEVRRVVGSFHRSDVPPVSDRPIVEQVDDTDREVVYVDYDPTPDDWNLYVDSGCGYESDPNPDPAPETSSGGGGCEGDTGGGDSYDSGGGGCEGDSGGGGGGGGGCEGDTGGGGGCEGDTGGGSGCEGGSGSDCAVGGRHGRGGPNRVAGRLLPYAVIAIGRLARRRPRQIAKK